MVELRKITPAFSWSEISYLILWHFNEGLHHTNPQSKIFLIQNLLQILRHMDERLHHTNPQSKICYKFCGTWTKDYTIQTHNPKFASKFCGTWKKDYTIQTHNPKFATNFVAHGRKITLCKPTIHNLLLNLWHMDERLHHTNPQSKICF